MALPRDTWQGLRIKGGRNSEGDSLGIFVFMVRILPLPRLHTLHNDLGVKVSLVYWLPPVPLPSPRTTRCWCQSIETREHTKLQLCLWAQHRYCWPQASPRLDSQSNPQPNWGSELLVTKVLGGKSGSRRGSTHRGRRNLFSFPYTAKHPAPIILNASPPALSSEMY